MKHASHLQNTAPIPRIPLSQETLDQKRAELDRQLTLRKEVMKRLIVAREMGDLSENSGYRAAKFELGSIGRQLRELNHIIKHAYVPVISKEPIASFGKKVTLQNDTKTIEFTLVGEYEVDILQKKYSLESPIGKAVMGKKVGDTVELISPNGRVSYKIVELVL